MHTYMHTYIRHIRCDATVSILLLRARVLGDPAVNPKTALFPVRPRNLAPDCSSGTCKSQNCALAVR